MLQECAGNGSGDATLGSRQNPPGQYFPVGIPPAKAAVRAAQSRAKVVTVVARVFDVDPWQISTRTFDPRQIRLIESMTSMGNGHMGSRGNFEEGFSGDSHLGTYIAGVWFPDKTRVGWWKNGYPEYFGKAINAVDFQSIPLRVNGEKVDLATADFRDFHLALDLRRGVLIREFRCDIGGMRLSLRFERFLSIVESELSFQRVTVTVIAGTGTLRAEPRLNGDVHNLDSNYGEQFWEEVSRSTLPVQLSTRTKPNAFGTPRFTVTVAMDARAEGLPVAGSLDAPLLVGTVFEGPVSAGDTVVLTKTVAVVTSRDHADGSHTEVCAELLHGAAQCSFDEHLADQSTAWGRRWQQADIEIDGDPEAQQGIRFNLYQLFSTYYGEDERLNIGPKGFTGEKYGGATYWDTEAYLLPMYLSVSKREVALALLRYRHAQLEQAKHNARQQGLPGALFPMVTFDGIECHNEWEITFEEIHRNGAIAYAIYYYTRYTGDRSYLDHEGIEVLTEIARFWAGRVHFSKHAGKYMIHGVTGPNEYENNVNNNWYTNYLAAWVLRYTLQTLAELPATRSTELGVTEGEKNTWRDIVDRMYFPEDSKLGIKVQHDTFLDKDLMPASDLDPSERPLNKHWSWDRILRSCFIKQADVLQGLYLFEHEFTTDEIRRNFEFYEPMTVHESSLSPSVHSILASAIGLHDKAVELYKRTARLDLDNYNDDTDDGLHITSMSGSWLAIVQGFAGMRADEDGLRLAPFCPAEWDGYSFMLRYRGRLLRVQVRPDAATVSLVSGENLDLTVSGRAVSLLAGAEIIAPIASPR